MPELTFAALCTSMDAAGVEVRVAFEGEHHVIGLLDFHGCRSLDVPVVLGFDRKVVTLCCSLALCADVPGCTGRGVELARAWPELAELARSSCQTSVAPRDPSA